MADQGLGNTAPDHSIDGAASAIMALLKQPATPEPAPASQETEPAPQEAAQPEPEQNTSEQAPQGEPAAVTAEAEPTREEPTQAQTAPQPVTQAQQPATPDPTIAARNQHLAQLNQLVPQLQAQLAVTFPDVRTVDDLIRLSHTDPARALAYQVQERALMQKQGELNALAGMQRAEWQRSEAQKLEKLIPDIADPQKGPELKVKILKFAKEQGYSDQQIEAAGANDVALLHEAMMYRDSVKAKQAEEKAKAKAIEEAKKKAAVAPPVQNPGSARSTSTKEEKSREAFERLQKTGRIDDAAAVFKNFL